MHIYMLLAWLYIGSGFIVIEHSTHLVWTRRSSHDAADVIVLWITYSVNIDRQAGPCMHTFGPRARTVLFMFLSPKGSLVVYIAKMYEESKYASLTN